MRYDDHFGQLKILIKKDYIFGWNVLHSMMFQVYFGKIHKFNFNNLNERVPKWMSNGLKFFSMESIEIMLRNAITM